jgi:uncharacterized membrane protein HdeD (DUF308 family)
MLSMTKELTHIAHITLLRGALMLLLGLMAVIWPASVLVAALAAVGVVATVFGLYELAIGVSLRPLTHQCPLVLLHGAATAAFGMLTLGSLGLSLEVGLVLTGGWLALYAILAAYAAVLAWATRAARWALLAWASFSLGVAIYAVVSPEVSAATVLVLGPLFAAAFGAWQLAVGLWLRRIARKAVRSTFPPSLGRRGLHESRQQ